MALIVFFFFSFLFLVIDGSDVDLDFCTTTTWTLDHLHPTCTTWTFYPFKTASQMGLASGLLLTPLLPRTSHEDAVSLLDQPLPNCGILLSALLLQFERLAEAKLNAVTASSVSALLGTFFFLTITLRQAFTVRFESVIDVVALQ